MRIACHCRIASWFYIDNGQWTIPTIILVILSSLTKTEDDHWRKSLYHQTVWENIIGRLNTDHQSQLKWSKDATFWTLPGYCFCWPRRVLLGPTSCMDIPGQNIGHLMALIPVWGIRTSGHRAYFWTLVSNLLILISWNLLLHKYGQFR